MHAHLRTLSSLLVLVLAVVTLAAGAHTVSAAPQQYVAYLSGPAESPPNASPGTGIAYVTIDPVAHTMSVNVTFSGLIGTTTNSHIHAATATAGSGTAGVATTTPTFPGFPSGVTSGAYSNNFDMTLASSYNPTYVTNNGGTTATAEAALFQAIIDGKAYYNVHSQSFPGGEIRGFLQPVTVKTEQSTWGGVKALYR